MPTLESGLHVLDVGAPEAITPVGFYDIPGVATGIEVVDDLVYVASAGGLYLLRYLGFGNAEFSEQPHGGWFEVGMPLELCVSLSDTVGSLTYEWRKDGQPLAGGTDSCYTVEALAVVDEGWYVCRALDGAKAVYESDPAYVQVFAAGSLPAMGGVGLAIAGSLLAGWVIVRGRGGRRR